MMNPVMPAEGWLLVTLVIYCIWMLVDDLLISHINEYMSAIGNKLVTLTLFHDDPFRQDEPSMF